MAFFQYGSAELEYLKKRDARLGQAIDRIGRIERGVEPDLFTALVSCIVAQQISSTAAVTVWKRVQGRFQPFTPHTLCAATVETIQQCGMSTRKAGFIWNIARAAAQGEIELAGLADQSDEEVVQRLSALPGIGTWTAEMMLLFSLQRPDVVSWGDLGIRRGMMNLYGLENLDKTQFEAYRQRYSPYGSVASLYLWQIAVET